MIGLDRLLGMVFQFERTAATLEVARNLHTTIATNIGAQPMAPQLAPLLAPPDGSADAAAIDAALDALEGRAASPPLGAAATLIGLRQPSFARLSPDASGSMLTLIRAAGAMDQAAGAAAQASALPGVLPGPAMAGGAAGADGSPLGNGPENSADRDGGARADMARLATGTDAAAGNRAAIDVAHEDSTSRMREGSPAGAAMAAAADSAQSRRDTLAEGVTRDAATLADHADAIAAAVRGASSGQQTERAGIIASFMLNAAMLPGWPGERRFEPLRSEGGRWPLPTVPQGLNEADLLTYLANMGLRPAPASRLMRGIKQIGRRLRLLLGLGLLLARVRLVLTTLKDEFEALSEDDAPATSGRTRQRPSRWQQFL